MKPPENSPDAEMIKAFKAAGLVDYMQYLQSGKSIMWTNFTAGVAKGLGMTLGMTVVRGGLIWILAHLVALPVIGEYFGEAEEYISAYIEKTDYKAEFEEMNHQLGEINAKLGASATTE